MNEIARMMDTTIFKELKLAGYKLRLSMHTAPKLVIEDTDGWIVCVDPVVTPGRTFWMVGEDPDNGERFNTWDEVEDEVYRLISSRKDE